MAPVLLTFVALLWGAAAIPVSVNPVDCNDVYYQNRTSPSGVYMIYPSNPRFGIPVYCDVDTPGGPWTVIMRRMDGSANFYRPWDQYVNGFGDIEREYWLGLEFIHKITQRRTQKLLVELEDFEGSKTTAEYSSFSVGGDCDGYKLSVSKLASGGAGDSLSQHNGMKFSTFDKDQDGWSGNCAKSKLGGFWYKACYHTNPTGVYQWGAAAKGTPSSTGVAWSSWKGVDYSVKSISFKIHPV